MKKVLSIVLSLMLLLAVVPVGTISAGAAEDDVIEIRTIAELYNINNNMSGNYKLMNDIDMTNDVAVGGDWDFMGNGWEPIGSNGIYTNTAFTGTFDGDDHKIIGMKIEVNTKPSGTGTVYLGLFANNAGTIKNLGIDSAGKVNNGDYSGGICAYNSGTILNCYNEADVISSSGSYSGGICGYNSGNISNCHNKAAVSSGKYSGGICGYSNSNNNETFINCYNNGNVSSNECSGGIFGYSTHGMFINCYNTGNISSSNSSGNSPVCSGGICGIALSGEFTNCYNTGDVTSTTLCSESQDNSCSNWSCAGGICGKSFSIINNCYNKGNVIAESNVSNSKSIYAIVSAHSYVFSGGICGLSYNSIYNSYNSEEISASSYATSENPNYYSMSKAFSNSYCGGICGANFNPNKTNVTLFAEEFTNGEEVWYAWTWGTTDGKWIEVGKDGKFEELDKKVIFARLNPNAETVPSWDAVWNKTEELDTVYGGTYTITGWGWDTLEGYWAGFPLTLEESKIIIADRDDVRHEIANCYNTAEITSESQSSTNNNYSINYNGGIVGLSNTSIDGCYNVGKSDYAISYPNNGVPIQNCYYLNTAGSSNTGAKALTNAQLQLEMCMTDFDFANTWVLDKVTEYKYPQLKNNRQELATNPESIEITLPDKISYIIGEGFDTSGMVVMGHYANGVEQEISFYDISGFTGEVGRNNITVTVGEKSAVFYVTVHDEGEWTTVKQPTCTEKGEKKLYCTDCGELLNTEVIPAKGHTEVVDKGHDATCTESGLTDGSHCSVCDTILTEQKIIPAKGHIPYQNWEIIKNPTCTSRGEKVRYCSVCGEVAETTDIDVTDHQIVIDESKDATCLTSGLTEGSHCSVCNTVIVPQQVIQPKGHQWDEGEIITQPTCTKTGEKIYHCKNCEHTKSETISALGHNYSDEYMIDKAATCTEDGSKSRHCSRCEAVTDVTVIEKHGHDWDNGTYTKHPTCIATGEKVYHCQKCEESRTETVSALGHSFSDEYTIDKAATCTQNGEKSRHCSRCEAVTDVTVIEKYGHDWDNGTYTKHPTCIATGEKVYHCQKCEESRTETVSALGHNFSDEYTIDKAATCTQNGEKSRHCSRCEAVADVTVIEKHGHSWDDGTVTKQPTCTATGEKVYHCKNCDKTHTETISALGHNFSDEFTIDKEAACNQDGTKSRHCSRCNAVTDVTTIEKHNHIWDDGIVTRKPTCITEGVKTYHCQKCEQTKTETISVLGHKFSDEYTVDKAATCTQDGIKSRHCSRCEAYTDEVVIEKLGHNFSDEFTVDKEATCTENGSKSRHCSRCDACTDETIIEKHGHDWNDGTVTKQPTCTTTGEKVYNCKNCEQTKTETLYALGHDYSDEFTIDKEATCTEDGSKSRHCTRCDAHTDEVVIEKHGHHTELVSNHAATYFANGYTGDNTCTVCGKVISKGKAIAKLKLATPKVKITAGKQKLTAKYTKVKDATGFQVKYIYKGKTTTKTYTSKKSVTKTIKKLKKGTYKVSVRALIKSKGKTAYSNWTKAKKVKVK